mmetsp:Transcript_43594/g.57759  ORF Transcript_43594/g.57759 Transcript_43594/m.57759 type:complete len:200 (-) Transcript_43594:358-957(-)|eukprot:CAMPEP_0185579862 /NCGR_PEP_ID=MMETSP0434-20130131/15460_1 /TAXON_ID=626734 ORGANISM="Favella taraikaensis, Strain Fe Narragansett Bay" /NCGR_SAMPLE_ID=MMETSP0434 /ASSEMBLY_ACC=CAM_ASM_000379 /LENGTH=199 /DNA_ID=CAMNT_0028197969 /DNA_START=126 /DNA_END=725 /DNA_ORIENTATION=-
MRWELNVEGQKQVTLFASALNWHALVFHKFARLRADLLIDGDSHNATVESAEGARHALESIEQGNLLFEDQVVPRTAIALMLNLLDLDDKVGSDVARRLVAHLLEDKLGALAEARLDLHLLDRAARVDRFRVVVHHFALVVDLFHRAVIQLFQGAVDRDNDVFRLGCFRRIEAAHSIREDTLLHVAAVDGARLEQELCV